MTYRAVVKYALDATDKEKKRALLEGLKEIAMELVAEHDYDMGKIESAFEDAASYAQDEVDAKRMREEDQPEGD
jgi:hypothetical protein